MLLLVFFLIHYLTSSIYRTYRVEAMGNMLSRKKTKWNVWSQREKHTNTIKESQSWKYGARTSVMHTINCINYSWIITSNIVFMYVLCIYAWKKNEKAFFPLLFTILQFPIVYAIQYIFAPSTFYYFVWRFTSLFFLLAQPLPDI